MNPYSFIWYDTDTNGEQVGLYLMPNEPTEINDLLELSQKIMVWYNGADYDYLPFRLHQYLLSSRHLLFGLRYVDEHSRVPSSSLKQLVSVSPHSALERLKGPFVGFCFTAYLDRDTTRFSQAQRVHRAHRKKGLSRVIDEGYEVLMREIEKGWFPNVIRERRGYRTSEKVLPSLTIFSRKNLITPVYSQWQQLIRADHARRFNEHPPPAVRQVNFSEAFEFSRKHPQLFDSGKLVCNWVVFEPTLENFALLELGGRGEMEHAFFTIDCEIGAAFCAVSMTGRTLGFLWDWTFCTPYYSLFLALAVHILDFKFPLQLLTPSTCDVAYIFSDDFLDVSPSPLDVLKSFHVSRTAFFTDRRVELPSRL